jgi:hypothetical protein
MDYDDQMDDIRSLRQEVSEMDSRLAVLNYRMLDMLESAISILSKTVDLLAKRVE